MLFITYLQKEEKHQIFEKVSADYKLKNLFQFYPFLFIKITFPELEDFSKKNLLLPSILSEAAIERWSMK